MRRRLVVPLVRRRILRNMVRSTVPLKRLRISCSRRACYYSRHPQRIITPLPSSPLRLISPVNTVEFSQCLCVESLTPSRYQFHALQFHST